MFEKYYFLFGLALVWIVFAVVQDLRTREVSNWLNFSLIAFALSYRAFWSIWNNDLMFFVYGALGILIFVGLAYLFYYGRAFAGGDAKLLMGLGGVLPFESLKGIVIFGGGFVFLLFGIGAVYSLVYTFFLVFGNWEKFVVEFKREYAEKKLLFVIALFSVLILQVIVRFYSYDVLGLLSLLILIFPLLLIYTKAVEKGCLIKMVGFDRLREGDWLEENVKVGGKIIKKNVHGLSLKEIRFLKKNKKNVLIKEGIPFTPAFFFAFILGV